MTHEYDTAAENFAQLAQSLGLTISAAFVPFSTSRNAKEANPSLNWRCSIMRNGAAVRGLESVDYMQGSGHCPASKAGLKRFPIKPDLARAIAMECESGKCASMGIALGSPYLTSRAIPTPTVGEVLSSLCLDASALDHATFEDWASDYGYDIDSRSAETIYRACLAVGLALRAAVGDEALQALRDLASEM